MLDDTERLRVVLQLPLLLFEEVFRPDIGILEVAVCGQLVVQVKLVDLVVLPGEVVLIRRQSDLLLFKLHSRIVTRLLLVFVLVSERHGIVQPVNMLLHVFIKTRPLISSIALRELPEDLAHAR